MEQLRRPEKNSELIVSALKLTTARTTEFTSIQVETETLDSVREGVFVVRLSTNEMAEHEAIYV